jgi:Fur family peroxide stress response transcriptional regulator
MIIDGTAMEKLIQSLRKRGLKITPQRLAVSKILSDNRSHPSAEEIYMKVRKDYPTISLATIYQTLDTLEHVGGIRVLRFDKRRTRYDPDLSIHHHLICSRCHKIMDLHHDYSKSLRLPRALRDRFEINGFNVIFYGVCEECKNREKTQKRRVK